MNLALLSSNAAALLDGIKISISIVAASVFFAAILSIPLVLGLRSRSRIIVHVCGLYLTFFRGSPIIAQLFLVYYGSGQFRPELQSVGMWWFFRDAFLCSVLTFSLNSAAYTAALLNGAINAVPAGQWEAAQSLGLRRVTVFGKVVLPQLARIALPAYGNEIILLLKASAICTVVTIFDLMGTVRLIYSKTFDLSIYLSAALMYLAMVQMIRSTISALERHLFRWP